MRTVVLYGAGSAVIVDAEETCTRCGWEIAAIIKNFDGTSFAQASEKMLDLVQVTPELLKKHSLVFPLFTPGHRKYAVDQARILGAEHFDPLIDPTAILPSSLEISEGVYINCGVIIGGVSRLGAYVFVNRGASLGHHLTVEEFASIGPGVITGGNVHVGRGAVLGTGAVILPGIRIGANAVVAGGAVVIRDVPDNSLVVGNPARIAKENIAGYNGVGI